MTDRRKTLAATLAASMLALSAGALAHSGGGGSSGGSASGGSAGGGRAGSASASGGALHDNKPVCAQGYAFKNGGCVRVSQGVLPDADLYRQGRALAVAGYYRDALPLLEAVQRTDDSMVYTMRGYAERKLGHIDTSMALYARALAIDPGNVNTHEYMGEAYVVMGQKQRARFELATVQRLCGGPGCEQYDDLAKAIATGQTE